VRKIWALGSPPIYNEMVQHRPEVNIWCGLIVVAQFVDTPRYQPEGWELNFRWG